MKLGIYIAVSLFVVGVLLGVAQMWMTIMSAENFAKTEITLGAFFAITAVILFIKREYREEKHTQSSKTLD